MGKLKTLLLAAAAGSVFAAGANAADLAYPPPIIEAPEVIPVPIKKAGGWYLRGHIGMSSQKLDRLDTPLFETSDFTILDDGGFDSAPFVGVGLGYKFNKWLRFDVIGEYRGKASFHALDSYEGLDGTTVFSGTNDYSGTKSEWLGMANAYVDLGSWKGLTPYVGGGIGFSRNTIDHFRDINVPNGGVAYADADSKWNFAWALHAGLAYEVTPRFTVDLAYRYIDLGDARTGPVVAYDGPSSTDYPMHFKGITSHDIMLGMRWKLGGHHHKAKHHYEPEPYFEPAPIIGKY